jgi:CRISP-associated protein Cas1
MRKLYDVPRLKDRWSYLYFDECRIDKNSEGLIYHDKEGSALIPIDQVGVLMLGPGTRITHEAVKALADNNSLIAWVGQDGVRCYAHSTGGTYSSKNLILQAERYCDYESRLKVARRMYQFRFHEDFDEQLTIHQIRGMEGNRVRKAYSELTEKYGVEWKGRKYNQNNWYASDPANRALSAANACLYGICHAGIVSAGFSAAIGFIHTGKMLSFVYDIADLYKTEITVPLAFKKSKENPKHLEREVRMECRKAFYEFKIMERIIPDIMEVLDAGTDAGESTQDFEGTIITLADRAKDRDFFREPKRPGKGGAME